MLHYSGFGIVVVKLIGFEGEKREVRVETNAASLSERTGELGV